MQVPAVTMVAVVPATVHTLVVVDSKVTASPDEAVALRGIDPAEVSYVVTVGANVMVCVVVPVSAVPVAIAVALLLKASVADSEVVCTPPPIGEKVTVTGKDEPPVSATDAQLVVAGATGGAVTAEKAGLEDTKVTAELPVQPPSFRTAVTFVAIDELPAMTDGTVTLLAVIFASVSVPPEAIAVLYDATYTLSAESIARTFPPCVVTA